MESHYRSQYPSTHSQMELGPETELSTVLHNWEIYFYSIFPHDEKSMMPLKENRQDSLQIHFPKA